jgi:hypothetical protein
MLCWPVFSRLRVTVRLAAPLSFRVAEAASLSLKPTVTFVPLTLAVTLPAVFLTLSLPTTSTPRMKLSCGVQTYW